MTLLYTINSRLSLPYIYIPKGFNTILITMGLNKSTIYCLYSLRKLNIIFQIHFSITNIQNHMHFLVNYLWWANVHFCWHIWTLSSIIKNFLSPFFLVLLQGCSHFWLSMMKSNFIHSILYSICLKFTLLCIQNWLDIQV